MILPKQTRCRWSADLTAARIWWMGVMTLSKNEWGESARNVRDLWTSSLSSKSNISSAICTHTTNPIHSFHHILPVSTMKGKEMEDSSTSLFSDVHHVEKLRLAAQWPVSNSNNLTWSLEFASSLVQSFGQHLKRYQHKNYHNWHIRHMSRLEDIQASLRFGASQLQHKKWSMLRSYMEEWRGCSEDPKKHVPEDKEKDGDEDGSTWPNILTGKKLETLTEHRMFVILELLESKVNQFQLISTSSKGKGICDEVQLTYVLVD